MRIASHIGAALVALCVAVLPSAPAMAEGGDVTVAVAVDPDVPDLQETPENPADVDPNTGDEVPADPDLLPDPHCQTGSTQDQWSKVLKPWSVTHAKGYENFSGGTSTYTRLASWEKTLDASYSWTGEGGGSASVRIAQLEIKSGFTLALNGKKTNAGSESVTATMSPNHVFIFYAGARRASGSVIHYLCNGIKFVNVGHGSVRSFGLRREGAVRCGANVSSSTLGYVVERDYC